MDANGNPVRIFVTAVTTADCTLGEDLIQGINAKALLADRGYDVNKIIEKALRMGLEASGVKRGRTSSDAQDTEGPAAAQPSDGPQEHLIVPIV